MSSLSAQDLPYDEIPDTPDSYTACHVMARMIDGLGYRYYWGTEGLTTNDLSYSPGNEGRPAREVLDHIRALSETMLHAVTHQVNMRPAQELEMSWEETRAATLNNLKSVSDILKRATDAEMETYKISFQRGDRMSSFDYWHMINGPIADALTHVGQIVSYRRSTGNPQSSKVNVFTGKNRE
jgi:hypothetical protein